MHAHKDMLTQQLLVQQNARGEIYPWRIQVNDLLRDEMVQVVPIDPGEDRPDVLLWHDDLGRQVQHHNVGHGKPQAPVGESEQ
jgi:hypothetical protein